MNYGKLDETQKTEAEKRRERRGRLVTEIEMMGTAGQLDRLAFIRDDEERSIEAENIVRNIVKTFALDLDTDAGRRERKYLIVGGTDWVFRVLNYQKSLLGQGRERRSVN